MQDEIDAKEGWPAGDNETKRTMERTVEGVKQWHTSEVIGGSPGQENSKKMQKVAPPVGEAGKEKTDPLIKPASAPLPLHFVLALAIALALAPSAVWLRRYFLKRANSFGDPGH